MATLETGTTLKQPLTGIVTLKEKLSGDTYLRKYLPDKYPDPAPPPPLREGGEGARNCSKQQE